MSQDLPSPKSPPAGWTALLWVAPLMLCGPGLLSGKPIGSHRGELWGHLFTLLQCERWASGSSPVGIADLLNAPEGQPFWPTSPVIQLFSVPLGTVMGHLQSWNLSLLLLLFLAGLGPALLCRRLGSSLKGAVVAGWMVQLSPFLLRNMRDSIIEVGAIGIMALCLRSAIALLQKDSNPRRCWTQWFVWLSILAGTSPYFMVYLALGMALLLPWIWHFRRDLWKLAMSGALIAGLFLTPFLWTESGAHGRLGPEYAKGGYQLDPSPLELSSGERVQPGPTPGSPPPESIPSGVPSPVHESGVKTPGNPLGWTLSVCLLVAVTFKRSRAWALGAGALLLIGPGPSLVARATHLPAFVGDGLLSGLLRHLPLLSSLGNSQRLLAPITLLIAVSIGLAIRRRWLPFVATSVLIWVEAQWVLGGFHLPQTPVLPRPSSFDEVDGSLVVFPSGEPPYWSWRVGPKEALYLAAREGRSVAQDYGRGRVPGDLMAHIALATRGDVGLGRDAWMLQAYAKEAPEPGTLLLLESRLEPHQVSGIRSWLELRGEVQAQDVESSTWHVDSWALYATSDPPEAEESD